MWNVVRAERGNLRWIELARVEVDHVIGLGVSGPGMHIPHP